MDVLPIGSLAIRGGRNLAGAPMDVEIVAGVVAHDGPDARTREFDASGYVISPGYVDLQVNGAKGVDLTAAPNRLWDLAAALPGFGVTSFLPTIVTSSRATVDEALAVFAAGPPAGWRGARPVGLHLEGPMIALERAGAHDVEHIVPPSVETIEGWARDAGVTMVTLAPELPGALAVIAELVRRDVVVAAGHTEATAEHARAAVDAGLTAVTHLFNAMAPLHHRVPGLAGATLAGLPVTASLIADGRHIDPDMVRLAWRALGPERRILVSDAVAPLGAPSGHYVLAGRQIVFDGECARTEAGDLAGGVTGLDACVRNVVAMTACSAVDAVRAVTVTPARLIGRAGLGVLRPGASGDVVVLDGDLQVVATIVAGVVVHSSTDR